MSEPAPQIILLSNDGVQVTVGKFIPPNAAPHKGIEN
jgi:hypothetical protein